MAEIDQIPLSDELLAVMRNAAQMALGAGDAFITPRLLLLALLEDPVVGPPIATVVVKEKLLEVGPREHDVATASVHDEQLGEEAPALQRYDTLAFKDPQGDRSVWLSKDAYAIFLEGAQRVEERYLPKQLALGFAAQAVHAPGVLAAIRVEPGRLTDAVYKL